jgi:cytoskeletal protein CcmA (bactofilin family)
MNTAVTQQHNAFPIPADFSTVVCAQTHLVGDLQGDAGKDLDLRVEGIINGSVVIPQGGVIVIDATGTIDGERIEADYIVVKGIANGKIICRKGLEIAAGSTIKGDIEYHGTLEMQRTSRVNASISFMGQGN